MSKNQPMVKGKQPQPQQQNAAQLKPATHVAFSIEAHQEIGALLGEIPYKYSARLMELMGAGIPISLTLVEPQKNEQTGGDVH